MKGSIMVLPERRDHLEEIKKRKSKEEKKLSKAINTLASIIEAKALSMMECIEGSSDSVEIKQIKELTGAVKELSALIYQNSNESMENTSDSITVIFEGEGEEWAK